MNRNPSIRWPACLFTLLTSVAVVASAADQVVLVAGGGTTPDGVPAIDAKLTTPFGVDFDPTGNLLFVELNGHRVGRIDTQGRLTTLGGTGNKGYSGDGGSASKAEFNGPHNLTIAPNGDLYVADTWNNVVRKVDAKNGIVSTIAGTGEKGFSGDGGPATKAQFGGIYCASLDAQGEHLYLADLDNRRIRAVNLKTGLVRTVAGNGESGRPRDGSDATNAPLVDPRAVIAAQGMVYVLERGGHALRVVDAQGQIRTVAGTGKAGNSGDGGEALAATLNGPKHLCFDHDGSVLVADTENHVIRRFIPQTGKIERVAGTGRKGTGGLGGPPASIELSQPHGVYVHASGDLYISDSFNHRILKIVRGK